ncbi:MAG: hypothetical protein AB7N76_02415 [Planctomycetota bacterium]
MSAPANARPRERGMTLMVVLALLALFSLYATALVSVLDLEQRASANQLDAVRAEAVAEAGLQRARFLLAEHELSEPIASQDAPWRYRAQDGLGPGLDLPLADALHPSFCEARTAQGLAYSGGVSSSYGLDVFSLQVVDEGSRLCLNSRHAGLARQLDALGRAIQRYEERRATPGDPCYSQAWVDRLRRTYEELVPELGQAAARARVSPRDPVAGRGAQVVALRAALGALSAAEELEPTLGADDAARLAPYVSFFAWRDPRRDLVAPVCLNTAPWPVLVSCLDGLEDPDGRRVGPAAAEALADAIDALRSAPAHGPFVDVDHLRYDLERVELVGLSAGEAKQARLLALANGRPDLAPGGARLDAPLHHPVSLDALVHRTTPFCFITYGRFRVRSLGRVLDSAGGVVAEAVREEVVSVYDALRFATQEDLELARRDDDDWSCESYPEMVGLGGARRFECSPDAAPSFSLGADSRRALRWRLGSSTSGYVFPSYSPPQVPDTGEARISGAQAFRFNPDLYGEKLLQGWARGAAPGGDVPTRLRPSVLGAGSHPTDLGLPGLPAPNPVETVERSDLSVAGLDVGASGQRVTWSTAGLLPSSFVITLRFEVGGDGQWVTLLSARTPPDERYDGLSPDTDEVRVEVRTRVEAGGVAVESRIVSSNAPDGGPAAVGQRVLVPATGNPEGMWLDLTLAGHGNDHVLVVGGEESRAWPVWGASFPAQPPGTLQVGGQRLTKPLSIDDLVVVGLEEDGGARLIDAYRGRAWPPVLPGGAPRWRRVGADVMGRYLGCTPELRLAERARFGPVVWSEHRAESIGETEWAPCDFLAQVSWCFQGDALRSAVSRRPLPPPAPHRLADRYVRYWYLRQLRQRLPQAQLLAARLEALASVAEAAPATPGAAGLRARAAALRAEAERLAAEERQIVASHGEPSAPPGDSASAAFGRRVALRGAAPRLSFLVEFLFTNQLEAGLPAEELALILSDLVVPYQTAPRALWRRAE